MIPETTSAKFEPRCSESSRATTASCTPSAPGPASAASTSSISCAPRRSRPRRANAIGTTTSETNGAAAMPRATASWPVAIPTATANTKHRRESASMNTRLP